MGYPGKTPYPQGPFLTGCLDIFSGVGREGTLIRLFYPAKLSGTFNDHKDEWSNWYLGEKYVEGLAKFYFPFAPKLYFFLANWFTREARVPCIWEAPLASKGALPVIVFSHGLTANRGTSSTLCNDLASHGFVVAVVEHKDESACGTFFLDKQGRKEWIPFRCIKSVEKEYPIRSNQVRIRAREVSQTLDIMERLNRNDVKNRLPSSFDLASFKGRLDLSKPILMGHSFGGATVVLALKKDDRFSLGVPLDPWMFPLKTELKRLSSEVTKPMLFILMEAFQDPKNLDAFKYYKKKRNTFITIKGTVHQNQVDTPFLTNYIGRILMDCNSSIDPLFVIRLNDKIIVNYIWDNHGRKKDYSKEYEEFIEVNKGHLIYAPYGTAKSMLGWASDA